MSRTTCNRTQTKAIALVAGTCIGGGIIALPLTLAKIGVLPSVILAIATWSIVYYASLFSIELNLRAGKGLDLEGLSLRFGGKYCAYASLISIYTLCCTLFVAYLSTLGSMMQEFLAYIIDIVDAGDICFLLDVPDYVEKCDQSSKVSFKISLFASSAIVATLLAMPMRVIGALNKCLFALLLLLFFGLIIACLFTSRLEMPPLVVAGWYQFSNLRSALLVIVYSFGFQVIFHTLMDFCAGDKVILKRSFFYGTLIPTVVYIVWNYFAIALIVSNDPSAYGKIVNGEINIGEFIAIMSAISNYPLLNASISAISLLAIVTSIIGVGCAIIDSIEYKFASLKIDNMARLRPAISIIMVLCLTIVASYIANEVLEVLSFAGMLIAIIGILIPIYLFLKNKSQLHYGILKSKLFLAICAIFGLSIIMLESLNADRILLIESKLAKMKTFFLTDS